MSIVESSNRLLDEIADLFASCPTREQLLSFHPSVAVGRRASDLISKLKNGSLSADDQQELDQFQQAELLMRLVKAKLHSQQKS